MVAVKFTVTAERGASGVWVLQCVEHPGAISETRALTRASSLMREAVAFVADIDADDIEIEVIPVLPQQLSEEIREARAAVRRLAGLQRETAEVSRAAVRHLVKDGYSGRDVAVLLDISPQRVSQLVKG